MKRPIIENPLFLIILILILTFIAFLPSIKNGFILTWDDNLFVTDNVMIRHLDLSSIKAMFTTPVAGAYVPLPLLTFAVEYQFFGLNPLPYHITNLVLHLLSTLLVFQFFRLLKLGNVYAAFGALIFGIHPMHVESVAWITERKDLLYGLFFIGSIILYLKYLPDRSNGKKYLILSFILFIFSLFSKIQAVVLPLILLLLDYYTKRDINAKLFTEKLPYFLLSFVFGTGGILILYKEGLFSPNEIYSLTDRFFYGLYALTGYIARFIVPIHQSIYYPYPVSPGQSLPFIYYLNPVILVVLGVLVYRTLTFTRVIVTGSLFFLFNIMFMLQILAAGSTYFADRYTYIPYTGLCFITGWTLDRLVKAKPGMKYPAIIIMSIVIIFFVSKTYQRCTLWKNGVTLWSDAIEKYKKMPAMPNFNRGLEYGKAGQFDKAISDFSKALDIDTDYRDSRYNRGLANMKLQLWNKVVTDFSRVIEADPENEGASFNRGIAFGKLGQPDKATEDFTRVIVKNPENKDAWFDRGLVYKNMKEWDMAIADFSMVIKIDPGYIAAYYNRGEMYRIQGHLDEAIADYLKTIELDRNDIAAYNNLGIVYYQKNDYDKAIEVSIRGLRTAPENAGFYDNIGYFYMAKGEYEEAINYFRQCLQINNSFFDALLGMAMAFYYKKDQANAKIYLNEVLRVEPRLIKGIDGITELEKSGFSFSEKKKETLKRMFRELK